MRLRIESLGRHKQGISLRGAELRTRATSGKESFHITLDPLRFPLETFFDSQTPQPLSFDKVFKQFYDSIVKLLKALYLSPTTKSTTATNSLIATHETITMNPTQKSPERAFALQKYLLLHSQHDALQKHLNQISSSIPTTAATSPSHSRSPDRHGHASLSPSPELDDNMLTSPPRVTRNHHRGGRIPQSRPRPALRTRRSSLPTVIDESILGEIEQDEMKLKDVNQQIKSTLTELLNCESVRGDRRYRMWIQTRLMDAEKELKNNRSKSCDRRRSLDASVMMF
jgi:hypothetical protein